MIKNIYSVFDKKAQLFCAPFCSINDDTATRDFSYAANDPTSDIGRYSIDYSLYFLGVFDDEKGYISTEGTRRHLVEAYSLINKAE